MSELPPRRAGAPGPEPHPATELTQRPTRADHLRRWEVQTAHWRARELAELFFGSSRSRLCGVRTSGRLRGLVRLDVPFHGLDGHRTREARFMAAVGADPVLSTVPLVYVLGPRNETE